MTAEEERTAAGEPAAGGETAGGGAERFDWKSVPRSAITIARDPAGALDALYKPGNASLYLALTLGLASAILIPVFQFLALKISMGRYYAPGFDDILLQCVGGAVFLASGAAASLLLRRLLAPEGPGSWQLDVFLVGCSMTFLLAGSIVWFLLVLLQKPVFLELAAAFTILALMLAVLCHHSGALKLGGLRPQRAVWVAPVAIAVALFVGQFLDFRPTGSGLGAVQAGAWMPGATEEGARDAAERAMEMLENMRG